MGRTSSPSHQQFFYGKQNLLQIFSRLPKYLFPMYAIIYRDYIAFDHLPGSQAPRISRFSLPGYFLQQKTV